MLTVNNVIWQGKEFAEGYSLEYQRVNGGAWRRYSNHMGEEVGYYWIDFSSKDLYANIVFEMSIMSSVTCYLSRCLVEFCWQLGHVQCSNA